MEKLVIMR